VFCQTRAGAALHPYHAGNPSAVHGKKAANSRLESAQLPCMTGSY